MTAGDPSGPASSTAEWAVVVPVKAPTRGKSRLEVPGVDRVALARAMALDAIAAVAACPLVARVIVVTDDPTLPLHAGDITGLHWVDEPAARARLADAALAGREVELLAAGLDGAVALGMREAAAAGPGAGDGAGAVRGSAGAVRGLAGAARGPAGAVRGLAGAGSAGPRAGATAERMPRAALLADLPALRPDDLSAALRQAASVDRGVVADAEGTGSTLVTAATGVAWASAFGEGSFARHVALGCAALDVPDASTLRRDVDTADQLEAATALGVGPRTAAVLAGH